MEEVVGSIPTRSTKSHDLNQSVLLLRVLDEHHVGRGIATYQCQALAVQRPLVGADFEGIEVGQLVARAAVQRLEPQIVHALLADGIHDAFAVRGEAQLPPVPRIIFERPQDLARIRGQKRKRGSLDFEVVGSHDQGSSVGREVV